MSNEDKVYTQEEVVKIIKRITQLRLKKNVGGDVFSIFGHDDRKKAEDISRRFLRILADGINNDQSPNEIVYKLMSEIWKDDNLESMTDKVMLVFICGAFLGFSIEKMERLMKEERVSSPLEWSGDDLFKTS